MVAGAHGLEQGGAAVFSGKEAGQAAIGTEIRTSGNLRPGVLVPVAVCDNADPSARRKLSVAIHSKVPQSEWISTAVSAGVMVNLDIGVTPSDMRENHRILAAFRSAA